MESHPDLRAKLVGDRRKRTYLDVLGFLCKCWFSGTTTTTSDIFLTTGLSKGSVISCVNDLVKNGLIEKRHGEQDRRQRHIAFTPPYRRILRQFIIDCHDDIVQNLLPCLKGSRPVTAKTAENDGAGNGRMEKLFVAKLSHDLRIPLGSIIGFSEMMKDGVIGNISPKVYKRYAEDIYVSARHLHDLVDDISDFCRLENSGTLPLNLDFLDVAEIVEQCIGLISVEADRACISIRHAAEENLPRLSADGKRLKQIVLNILGNSIRYVPTGGEVRISNKHIKGRGLEIRFCDNGPGIPVDGIVAATQPYVQFPTAEQSAHVGSGLGLAIVKSLTELHDGRFTLESSDQGTTATLLFPSERLELV